MRRAFTVAIVGPDGAGKSTIARRLADELPFPVRAIYMGVNLEASATMLPTTRAVLALKQRRGDRPDMVASPDPAIAPRPKGWKASIKSGLRVANWIAEEWFRQLIAWYHLARGRVVVFDRHFYCDYYAYDVAGWYRARTLSERVHGFVLHRLYPKPDIVIVLDAPVEVLASRRGASGDFLERRRKEYGTMLELFPRSTRIDVSAPQDIVVNQAVAVVAAFRRSEGISGP